jgi:very-short-patch-repair endonuclease
MLWYKTCGLVIIEIDGAVHDRKVAKTVERNRLYRDANIKLIVVNLADLKETKTTVEDYLDKELARYL